MAKLLAEGHRVGAAAGSNAQGGGVAHGGGRADVEDLDLVAVVGAQTSQVHTVGGRRGGLPGVGGVALAEVLDLEVVAVRDPAQPSIGGGDTVKLQAVNRHAVVERLDGDVVEVGVIIVGGSLDDDVVLVAGVVVEIDFLFGEGGVFVVGSDGLDPGHTVAVGVADTHLEGRTIVAHAHLQGIDAVGYAGRDDGATGVDVVVVSVRAVVAAAGVGPAEVLTRGGNGDGDCREAAEGVGHNGRAVNHAVATNGAHTDGVLGAGVQVGDKEFGGKGAASSGPVGSRRQAVLDGPLAFAAARQPRELNRGGVGGNNLGTGCQAVAATAVAIELDIGSIGGGIGGAGGSGVLGVDSVVGVDIPAGSNGRLVDTPAEAAAPAAGMVINGNHQVACVGRVGDKGGVEADHFHPACVGRAEAVVGNNMGHAVDGDQVAGVECAGVGVSHPDVDDVVAVERVGNLEGEADDGVYALNIGGGVEHLAEAVVVVAVEGHVVVRAGAANFGAGSGMGREADRDRGRGVFVAAEGVEGGVVEVVLRQAGEGVAGAQGVDSGDQRAVGGVKQLNVDAGCLDASIDKLPRQCGGIGGQGGNGSIHHGVATNEGVETANEDVVRGVIVANGGNIGLIVSVGNQTALYVEGVVVGREVLPHHLVLVVVVAEFHIEVAALAFSLPTQEDALIVHTVNDAAVEQRGQTVAHGVNDQVVNIVAEVGGVVGGGHAESNAYRVNTNQRVGQRRGVELILVVSVLHLAEAQDGYEGGLVAGVGDDSGLQQVSALRRRILRPEGYMQVCGVVVEIGGGNDGGAGIGYAVIGFIVIVEIRRSSVRGVGVHVNSRIYDCVVVPVQHGQRMDKRPAERGLVLVLAFKTGAPGQLGDAYAQGVVD